MSTPGTPGSSATAGSSATDTRADILREQAVDAASSLARRHQGTGIGALATEAMALAVAAVGAAAVESLLLQPATVTTEMLTFSTTLLRLVVTVPILAVALATTRTRWSLTSSLRQHLSAVARPIAAGGLIALVFWRLAGGAGLVRPPAAQAIGLLCGFGLVTVALARVAHHNLPVLTGHTVRRIVVVGSGIVANRVADQLQHDGGVDLVGFVDDDPLDPERCIGPLRDLSLVCEREGVDHIVVAFSRSSPEQLLEALNPLFGRMPITVVPRLFDVLPANAAVHDLGSGLLGISVAPATLGPGPRAIKRTIDIVGAGTALVLLSPLLAVVAGAIRLTSPGPALLRQHRIGRNGTGFDMVKFRSMLQPAPAAGTTTGPTASGASEAVTGPFPKLKNDPRVTRVGRLIRTTSIDELPQLWNVLKGEMSLVGPRPFVPGDAASIAGWARRRYAVRPGITGLWQVSGRNDLTFEEMCRLDSLYVSCWSVGLDLRVLLRTLRAVVTKSGAY